MDATTENITAVGLVRKRPEMYAGNTKTAEAPHHLLSLVLAHVAGEHLAGRCKRMDVTMHADGSISVSDDGPGISVEVDENGTSWLESILTRMHDLNNDDYAPHVHLRGYRIVLFVVSALSSSLSAEVRRDGQTRRIELEQGRVTKKLTMVGPADTSGTTIRFKLDATFFAMPELEVERVARRVRELSGLLPNLTTNFSCERRGYTSANGVVELLALIDTSGPRHGPATGDAQGEEASAQVAFQWSEESDETHVAAYCNLDDVAEGTHIDGFRRGLADALGREDSVQVYEALSPGLGAVVSVLVIDPNYTSRPFKVASKEAFAVVREATKRALDADPVLRQYLEAKLLSFTRE